MAFAEHEDHNDGVQVKMGLLSQALGARRYEIAMALADSIKDTIGQERQRCSNPGQPAIPASASLPVASLPEAWARWAAGWSTCQVITLEEPIGLERSREPVDLLVSAPAGQAPLAREGRLAHVDRQTGALREIPCQVYGELHRGAERIGRLVFMPSVSARGSETYLFFSGNPDAELPSYPTDLWVRGQGYGLDVENVYYVASLSRQMGQLERLTYKRGHGLELFAGGEGHGEPPNIDWAHDYLSADGYSKYRVTNWAACPNYEVYRGPLCVVLRRWGFPHSPVHPLFTPSRMCMDVSYTFYADTPYFLKSSRMDVIRDFSLNYLRDDEWVFSGYSFTDVLWMDEDKKLHEGPVPAEHQDRLWAVGFYHRDSHDAFIALHLEHASEGFAGTLYHAGAPVLDYQGHGQLWSRWAVREGPFFPAGSALTQRNAYLVVPYTHDAADIEACYQRLGHPLQATAGELSVGQVASVGRLARPGEAGDSPISKRDIWEALRDCQDDMLYRIDANVADMGYVRDVRVVGGTIHVLMTMPHRGRPKYGYLAKPMRERLLRLPHVDQVVIELTWDPPWSVNDVSDRGITSLGL